MKTSPRTLLAGLAVAGLLTFTSTALAGAAGPVVAGGPAGVGVCATKAATVKAGATVEDLREFGNCEIDRRVVTLNSLASKIAGSKVLASSDASALASEVSATKSGLISLKATIDAETSIPALKVDIRKIATDYRVYLLVAPQVNLVSAADGVKVAQARFADVNTKLTAGIAAAKAKGKDTTAAQADLDAMNAAVSQAASLAQPLPATLLALTPAGINNGTAGPVIKSARTTLQQARGLLQSARKDAQACRDALK
jgi:hypothetical protein